MSSELLVGLTAGCWGRQQGHGVETGNGDLNFKGSLGSKHSWVGMAVSFSTGVLTNRYLQMCYVFE